MSNIKNVRKSKRKKSTLAVMTKVRDLALYIFKILENAPQKYRLTMTNRLQNYVLDAIEFIYIANREQEPSKRLVYQEKALNKLAMIDYMGSIMHDVGCILLNQYENISLQVGESIKLLKAWMNANTKLVSTSIKEE